MSERIIARRVWTKELPKDHPLVGGERSKFTLTATAKLYSINGVQAPHFSLTGELRNLRKIHDPVEMAGCIHEELVAEWPELAPLAAIHLSNQDGVPMHAVENGAYWLGFAGYQEFEVRDEKTGRLVKATAPYLPNFMGLWRVSKQEAQKAYNYCRATSQSGQEKFALEVLACAMIPRWRTEAYIALKLLRGNQ